MYSPSVLTLYLLASPACSPRASSCTSAPWSGKTSSRRTTVARSNLQHPRSLPLARILSLPTRRIRAGQQLQLQATRTLSGRPRRTRTRGEITGRRNRCSCRRFRQGRRVGRWRPRWERSIRERVRRREGRGRVRMCISENEISPTKIIVYTLDRSYHSSTSVSRLDMPEAQFLCLPPCHG